MRRRTVARDIDAEETEAQDGCGEQEHTHEHRQDGARLEVLVGSGYRHGGKACGGLRACSCSVLLERYEDGSPGERDGLIQGFQQALRY